MKNGKKNLSGICFRVSNAMDRVSATTLKFKTTFSTTNATKAGQMLTLEETILNGRDWETITIQNINAGEAVDRKYDIVNSGLVDGKDFLWGYRQSEYDGFTMNRPSHAVYAFRDPAMASFYRLKWA